MSDSTATIPMTEDAGELLEKYLDAEEQGGQKIQGRNLLKLSLKILKNRRLLLLGLGAMAIANLAAIIEPRIFANAIDDAIVPADSMKLKWLSLLFLAITSSRVIAVISQQYLFETLGQRVTQDLRTELFAHLQRIPVSIYDKNPAGRLLTRVTNDVAALADMFSAGFVNITGNSLLILGTLASLFLLDRRLALIAVSILPVLLALAFYFGKRLSIAYREERSKLSALNAFLAENFLGMKVVHLFNRQKRHLERFDRINRWYADAQFSSIRIYALFQPAITLASGIAVALVVWYAGGKAWHGALKLGVLSAFFSYVLTLFQPLRDIAENWNTFLSGMASAERIFSILRWPSEMEEGAAAEKAQPLDLRGHIRFENVWFAYSEEHWVLKDFSLEILPGTRAGVVGHTGAGKTTLISLLLRFYEPQKGRILIDGQDIRTLDKRSLRAAIGIVQQDVFLFSGSIRDNLTFWDEAVPLPEFGLAGLQSLNLEERGGNLSMGQRQVLAFARALASDPRIWILDEATANMDSRTEAELQQALETASRGKTTILIAHRLSTVKSADQILVLHKGTLVESGRHEDLMRENGLYARLYRYQRAQERSGSGQQAQPVPIQTV